MIQKSFGLTIKAYREAIPISQEKYALKIGMDRTYYASVESGKRNISSAYKLSLFFIKIFPHISICN